METRYHLPHTHTSPQSPPTPGVSTLLARAFASSSLVLHVIKDSWLQCTTRSYNRLSYVRKGLLAFRRPLSLDVWMPELVLYGRRLVVWQLLEWRSLVTRPGLWTVETRPGRAGWLAGVPRSGDAGDLARDCQPAPGKIWLNITIKNSSM